MPYLPNTPADRQAMLEAIGVGSVEELFDMVPSELRLARELNLPPAMGEMELSAHMTKLAGGNVSADRMVCFLGGGCYDHFIPAAVDAIASRAEFYTAYTPYQPEASQGTLRAMFEYQTLITQLTGMDVSNASLYDGGSATAEAVLMAMEATRRWDRVVVAESVHPEYRRVLATYLANLSTELVTVGTPEGTVSPEDLEAAVDDRTACVVMQYPNFFGCLESVDEISAITKRAGAVLVASVGPLSLGVLRGPDTYGADIVVAEGQSLGIPMSFGGPYLGILACREPFVRRLPGRLVGQTIDRRGKRCYVLTLQTREQHIRREKATSNICTNQGLMALRATVYLALMGPHGLRRVADLCLQKASYAAEQLDAVPGLSLAFSRPTFKEFVIRIADGDVDRVLRAAEAEGILAGVPLRRWYPELADCLLVAVTETRTKREIDRLVAALQA